MSCITSKTNVSYYVFDNLKKRKSPQHPGSTYNIQIWNKYWDKINVSVLLWYWYKIRWCHQWLYNY